MGNLVIRDGAIYNSDGEKVKLEFGNIDQIKVIREYENRVNKLKNEGLELEPYYETEITGEVNFKCICGVRHYIGVEADYEDDIRCFNGEEKNCKCGNSYKIVVNRFEDRVLCKLITE